MKNGLIAAGVLVALLACARGDQRTPPTATSTGWESTQAGSSVPQTATEPQTQTEPAPTLGTQRAEAKRIEVHQAQQKIASGAAILVDVRDAQSYAFQHAQGALSIPLSDIAARAGELPKDKQIITYCT